MKYALFIALTLVGCTKAPPDDDAPVSADRGQRVATSQGCIACHSADGHNSVGPTWKGLYDSTVILNDGKSVVANKKYIYESILRPQAKIVKGFSPVMPPYRLDSSDLQSITLYIKSLK